MKIGKLRVAYMPRSQWSFGRYTPFYYVRWGFAAGFVCVEWWNV